MLIECRQCTQNTNLIEKWIVMTLLSCVLAKKIYGIHKSSYENEQITILIRETSNIKKLSLKSMILFAKNACHLKDLGPILCRK